jgi:hypothetical protein
MGGRKEEYGLMMKRIKLAARGPKSFRKKTGWPKTTEAKFWNPISWLSILILFACGHGNQASPEDFNSFYEKFNTDESFQKSRIIFPLRGINTDEMSVLDTVYYWKKEDWVFFPIAEIETSQFNFSIEYQPALVTEEVVSKEFLGQVFRRKYELLNGKWYLTYQADVNL